MTQSTPIPAGLTEDQFSEIDQMLDDMREREQEIPQWEFIDGMLTALVCTRRPVPVEEFLPMLAGDGEMLERNADGSLPVLPAFADRAQQERFLELWQIRWNEVVAQLSANVESLEEEDTFQPDAIDMRGAIASLPEEERAEIEGQDIPSFGQVWALGFMFVVENWAEEWEAPRDRDAARWLNDALDSVVALTEDDTGKPTVCMYDENGPASTSQERVETFGEAIWAVYDLRQIWKSMGPRQATIVKGDVPGRNDPCSCGSGKKFKKCCGA